MSNAAEDAVSGSRRREPMRICRVSDTLLYLHEEYSRLVARVKVYSKNLRIHCLVEKQTDKSQSEFALVYLTK